MSRRAAVRLICALGAAPLVAAATPASADWQEGDASWANSGSSSESPGCSCIEAWDLGSEDTVQVWAQLVPDCPIEEHTEGHYASAERQTTGVWTVTCGNPEEDEPGDGEIVADGITEYDGMRFANGHNWLGWMLNTWFSGQVGGTAEGDEYEDFDVEEEEAPAEEDWHSDTGSQEVANNDQAKYWAYISCHLSGGPYGNEGVARAEGGVHPGEIIVHVEPPNP